MDRGFVGDDSSLKHVSRTSHKISKPVRRPNLLPNNATSSLSFPNSGQPQSQSQQPSVYNINKNDFRDVVQKLTGSPARDRFPAPAPLPATQPRPPSSRLQRIRPPPLPQMANRPPHINQLVPHPQNDAFQRPAQPSFHPPAESPVSAYMRFLQDSASASVPSPMWNGGGVPTGPRPDYPQPQNNVGPPQSLLPPESPVSAYMRFLQNSPYSSAAPPPLGSITPPPVHPSQQQQQQHPSPLSPFPVLPSPPPFGCIPSPRSAYGTLFSPTGFPQLPLSPLPFGRIQTPRSPYGTLFSPTGQFGFPQQPLSPTFPFPSPRWKGI